MKLLGPSMIILSALTAGLANFIFPTLIGRPIIMVGFLCICPGMVLIRFLHVQEPVTKWTLAIALSLVIDAIVAGIQLYSGHWSPAVTLIILIGMCVIGVSIQVIQISLKQ